MRAHVTKLLEYEVCWRQSLLALSPFVRFGYEIWHTAMDIELRLVLSYDHRLVSFTFVALSIITIVL